MRIPIESSTSYRGRNSRPNWLALLAFIVLALAAGVIGALFAPGATTPGVATAGLSGSTGAWYASLTKPAWTPPDRWFGPVWTLLYVLMGTSVWLVWRERYHRGRNPALLAYAIQLALNALWAPIFFGTKNIGAGLFLIVALWLTLVWTLREFSAVRPAAAWLLLPYLGWVSVAVALNLSIWRHNQ
jgi:tryptophan-rich sensory protein